jgi:hypothetical protein
MPVGSARQPALRIIERLAYKESLSKSYRRVAIAEPRSEATIHAHAHTHARAHAPSQGGARAGRRSCVARAPPTPAAQRFPPLPHQAPQPRSRRPAADLLPLPLKGHPGSKSGMLQGRCSCRRRARTLRSASHRREPSPRRRRRRLPLAWAPLALPLAHPSAVLLLPPLRGSAPLLLLHLISVLVAVAVGRMTAATPRRRARSAGVVVACPPVVSQVPPMVLLLPLAPCALLAPLLWEHSHQR